MRSSVPCAAVAVLVLSSIGACQQVVSPPSTRAACPLPQTSADLALQTRLQSLEAARTAAGKGKTALYAVDLASGRTAGLDPDVPLQTASDIKLAILYEALVQIRAGKAHWDEPVVLQPGEAVGGSGMITFFDTPLRLTLKDILTMMVIVSDNTATNLAIDRFGIDAVNDRMASLGLKNTHLYKKVFKPATGPMPADQPRFGLGKSTAQEMVRLMTHIGLCDLHPLAGSAPLTFSPPDDADRAVCSVALTMLRNQFYRDTIPRYLEGVDSSEHGSAIASKTGSLDAVRNDVAIVQGKSGPIVIAIFTYANQDHGWSVDNEGEMEIARLAKEIVTAWSPSGIDGKDLVPGLGLHCH